MPSGVKIDGTDLDQYGVILDRDASGWRDGIPRNFDLRSLPGRVGQVVMDRNATSPSRTLVLSGQQRADSRSQLQTYEDDLKAAVYDGRLEVIFDDRPNRFYKAWSNGTPSFDPVGPQFVAPHAQDVQIELVVPDPLAYSTQELTVGFAGSQTAVPQGTGPVAPVIKIDGVTDPTIIYRDGDGNEVTRLELTASISSTWTIDCALQTITDAGGNNQYSTLSGGDFITMHGRDETSAGAPTLEISGSPSQADAIYRRSYL